MCMLKKKKEIKIMVGSALFAFISIPEGDDTLAVPVF